MKIPNLRLSRKAIALACLLLTAGGLAVTGPLWLPWSKMKIADWLVVKTPSTIATEDEHTGHDHGHAGHNEESSIELSTGALRNIDFLPIKIELATFVNSITVPSMVVERPGRSQLHITAPLTGIVTKIVPIQGSAIEPGVALFEIRLTHEELVTAQSNLIRTAESLDVVNREISRLQSVEEGVIAGKRILDQEYEKQKLEASLRAEQQTLLLHGLSDGDVKGILSQRQLFRSMTINAPEHGHDSETCREEHLFHVQDLPVKLGQRVEAGQLLCVLADHCELYIEGRAFEDDASRLREAVSNGWNVSASLLDSKGETDLKDELKLLYLADHVDPQSRAFRFYIPLPNQVLLDQTNSSGTRFLDWRFKPGQRMELRVPVEQWEKRIVLPVAAVVDEGAETYVYQQNGNHFDRIAVHIEHRDQRLVVVANDGSVFPGDVVAAQGAYQMHLALKNKSGGGVDPHAGHNH